ncbi:MAG: ribose 5-phosphate isomerase B [Niabella sp.]
METTFDLKKPIAIGSDHAGFEMKEFVISFIEGKDLNFKDFGPSSSDAVDYPDFAHPVANAVESGEYALGILLCGSGNGVAIAANKHRGIRAALCWDDEIAALARKHNNANILCIPARFISEDTAGEMIDMFLNTAFEGGRHEDRVNKIAV